MLVLKRLAVWFFEIVFEALLIGLLLIGTYGYDKHAFGKDLLIYAVAVLYMFFLAGYILSTAVSRAVWRGRKLWPYPAIGMILFLIHFEIMNIGIGGAFAPSDRLRIRAAGACIVFICTFAGSVVLRSWGKTGSKAPSGLIQDSPAP